MKLSNQRAQYLAESALIFSLVIAAIIAMQTYVKRGLQGRYRDATDKIGLALRTTKGDSTLPLQYEPYYTHKSGKTTSKITTTAGTAMSPNKVVHQELLGGSKKTTIDKTTTIEAGSYRKTLSALEAD